MVQAHCLQGMSDGWCLGQVLMDPYCPLIHEATVPDDMSLVAPKGAMARSMPITTSHLTFNCLQGMTDWCCSGQVMMDTYCPLIQEATVPDDMNLVAPRGGMAGSMPINTPELTLSSLSFLLDEFSFQVSLLACR